MQNDLALADQPGVTFLPDLNGALQALATMQSGATAPSTTYAHQLWSDTTDNVMKQRNAANSDWVVRSTLDEFPVLSRSSNTALKSSDRGKTIVYTATHTQTFGTAAALGAGWWVRVVINNGVTMTFDPASTELIDGEAFRILVGKTDALILCDGTAFRIIGSQQTFQMVDVRSAPWLAKGDGTSDDWARIQDAGDYVRTLPNGALYIPPHNPGAAYKLTDSLVWGGPITIISPGENAATFMASGFSSGQPIIAFDCADSPDNEHFNISGLTLRSPDKTADGIRCSNASYVNLRRVRLYQCRHGVRMEGVRTFGHYYEQLSVYDAGGSGIRFSAGFAGGGHHTYNACTLQGNTGFDVQPTAVTDGLTWLGCNFEQCITNSLYLGGSVRGAAVLGGRSEGGDGTADFLIDPASGDKVSGLTISGFGFHTDNGSSWPIVIGGSGGATRGFAIQGNSVEYAGLGSAFVHLNGEGASGVIAGNRFAQTDTQPVSSPRSGVVVYANENASGSTVEYWGTARWGVEDGTATLTDGSGAGLTITNTFSFTRTGNRVHWQCFAQWPATASGAAAALSGIPFTIAGLTGNNEGRAGAYCGLTNSGLPISVLQGLPIATAMQFYNGTTGAAITNANLSGAYMYLSGTFRLT